MIRTYIVLNIALKDIQKPLESVRATSLHIFDRSSWSRLDTDFTKPFDDAGVQVKAHATVCRSR